MILFILAFLTSENSFSASDPVQALYRKLNGGATLSISGPVYTQMKAKWDLGDRVGTAELATHTHSFYNLNLLQFSSKLLSQNADPFIPLNDFEADVIGVIRDRSDFRTLLTGNFSYQSKMNPEPARINTNRGYDLAAVSGNLFTILVRKENQYEGQNAYNQNAAGLLTTRAFAERYLSGGTNRRAVIAAFNIFLCAPISEWRDASLPDDRVRRDIDRIPGGNALTYQTECRGCHAPMDALAGAFNEWDFNNGTVSFLGETIMAPKVNQNGRFYPDGFINSDSSFLNPTAAHQQGYFQWGKKRNGNGPRDFGEMISQSGRFSSCLVRRVFEHVCKKSASEYPKETAEWAKRLESKNFDLLSTFTEVASSEACLNEGNI